VGIGFAKKNMRKQELQQDKDAKKVILLSFRTHRLATFPDPHRDVEGAPRG
jgi:hypothetical protein